MPTPYRLAIVMTLSFTSLATAADTARPVRLPTIAPADYTDDQKKAADDFVAARKVPVFGPFEPLPTPYRLAIVMTLSFTSLATAGDLKIICLAIKVEKYTAHMVR